MTADANWLEKNDGRNYPLDDRAGMDGGRLPTNALVDLHVSLPGGPDVGEPYVSRLLISRQRAELTISTTGLGPVLSLDVQRPEAYRGYLLQAVLSDRPVHGLVVFGSLVSRSDTAYAGSVLSFEEGRILPSRTTRLPVLPYRGVRVGPNLLRGVVKVEGEGGVTVLARDIAIPQPDGSTRQQRAIVLELENALTTLETPLRDCQKPLESGVLQDGQTHPVLSINGVYPDANGVIHLILDAQRFRFYDTSGLTREEPLLELVDGEGYTLAFRSNLDLSDLCGGRSRKGISYDGQSCVACSNTVVEEVEGLALARAFVHRQYLVIEFTYGGAGALLAGDVQPEFPDGQLSIVDRQSAQSGYGPSLAYDVTAECVAIPPNRPVDQPMRLVYRLNKIVRNPECAIRLIGRSGVAVEQPPSNRPAGYVARRSPAFDLCSLPVKDAFVFDGLYMTADDQQRIEEELLLYAQGQPLPEAP
jgi:hypothetical protein